jgi:hypothetical protein
MWFDFAFDGDNPDTITPSGETILVCLPHVASVQQQAHPLRERM